MNLSVSREPFLKALLSVIGAVNSKASLPIMAHVYLSSDGQTITLIGSDLQVTLKASFTTFDTHEPFTTTLPAKRLTDIVKAFPVNSTITFTTNNEKVTAKCGRSRFVLNALSAQDYPLLDQDTVPALTLEAESFRALIQRVIHASAHDDVRYYLNGVLLQFQEDRFNAVCTDGHRLAYHGQEAAPLELRDVIIPGSCMAEVLKLLRDQKESCTLSLNENHFKVQVGSQEITSKLIDGRFPDYVRVIPTAHTIQIVLPRVSLIEAIQRVKLIATAKDSGIALCFSENQLLLKSRDGDEESEEALDVEYSGHAFDMGMNANYLLDALKTITADEVVFHLNDATSSLKITSQGLDEGVYVIMPMRL